jgi:hypothetical protein
MRAVPRLKIRDVPLELLRVHTGLVIHIVRDRIPSAVIELVLREHTRLAQEALADPNRNIQYANTLIFVPRSPIPVSRKRLAKPLLRPLAARMTPAWFANSVYCLLQGLGIDLSIVTPGRDSCISIGAQSQVDEFYISPVVIKAFYLMNNIYSWLPFLYQRPKSKSARSSNSF